MDIASWPVDVAAAREAVDYLYDGVNVLAETDQSGNVLATYTGTEKVDEPLAELRSGTISYYDADGLSSISSLTNASGTIAATYTYDNFGNLSASTGTLSNPLRYTAREFDPEIGIYEYRARYYDQNVGRFISEDPLQFDGGDNFYAYTENNPVLYVDPFGLVRYNFGPPRTVPVTGQTAAALNCLEHCLQCLTNNRKLNLLVSGGAEKTGHTKNSYHYRGEAVDIHYSNPVSTNDVFRCAENCGFGAGGDEPKKNHWHLQLTPGNGSRPLPMVLAPVPNNECGCK
jgi:RHS repeat-associated protein